MYLHVSRQVCHASKKLFPSAEVAEAKVYNNNITTKVWCKLNGKGEVHIQASMASHK